VNDAVMFCQGRFSLLSNSLHFSWKTDSAGVSHRCGDRMCFTLSEVNILTLYHCFCDSEWSQNVEGALRCAGECLEAQ
jgi:hypothetical protein